MAITVCPFSKIFQGSMPPDSLASFWALELLKDNSAGKNALEKSDEN